MRASRSFEFDFLPSVGLLPLRFGMAPLEARAALGRRKPGEISRPLHGGPVKVSEVFKPFINIQFDSKERLIAVTTIETASLVTLNGKRLLAPRCRPLKLLAALGAPSEDRVGFLVFPTLGLALTGYHLKRGAAVGCDERTVTFFAPGKAFN